MKAYAKYATDVGKLIRDSLHQTQVTDNQIAIEVDEMIKFESALANVCKTIIHSIFSYISII